MPRLLALLGRHLPIVLGLLLVACDRGAEVRDPVYPAELVGQWVRIHPLHPPAQRRDTLTLDRDGAADGLSTHSADDSARVTRWQIGSHLLPGGFCVTIKNSSYCQAFRLRGDTLALANPQHTMFVRAEAYEALPDGHDRHPPDTSFEALPPAAPLPR